MEGNVMKTQAEGRAYLVLAHAKGCSPSLAGHQLVVEAEQLVVQTQKQVKKFTFFLLVPCLLCCCQVLLSSD